MKVLTLALTAFLAVLAFGGEASAQQFTLNVAGTVAFPYTGDPDVMPVSTAPPITINYKAAGMGNKGQWHFTIKATGPLASGGNTIALSGISWIGTGGLASGIAGSLSTTDFTLVTGVGNMTALRTGTLTFSLPNQWTFQPGNYSTTIVFTMSSP